MESFRITFEEYYFNRRYSTKYCVLLGVLMILAFVVEVTGLRARRLTEPKFCEVGHNVSVNEGETAVLKCLVDNLGPKTVVWRRELDDFPLSIGKMMYAPNEEMSIDHKKFPRDRTQWDLIIKRARPKHSGTYECQISSAKVYVYHVELTVLGKTSNYAKGIQIHGQEFVNRFSQIRLTCNATGETRAPEDIDWFHMGEKIRMNDEEKWQGRLFITKYQPDVPGRSLISQLVIERSRRTDSGTYICRSSDLSMKSIVVHVLNAEKDVTKREEDMEGRPLNQNVLNESDHLRPSLFPLLLCLLSVLYIQR